MSKFTREEKIALLQRGLQRRVDSLDGYIERIQANIKGIKNGRKLITDRIQKYQRDDYLQKILDAQLKQFDKTYADDSNRLSLLIDEAKGSAPQAERLLEIIENKFANEEVIELFIDLFLAQVLNDWDAWEKGEKERLEKEAQELEKAKEEQAKEEQAKEEKAQTEAKPEPKDAPPQA